MEGAWSAVLAGVVGLVIGGAAGIGVRMLLARIGRGVTCRPGPVEGVCAVLTGVGAALTVGGPLIAVTVWVGLLLAGLGTVDILRHRLPDVLTLPAVPITALLLTVTELVVPGTGSLLRSLLAAVVLAAAFGAVALLAPRAMGRGDVKLVPSIGLATGYLSWSAVVVAVVVAFVLAALVSLVGIAAGRLRASSPIAFGPFLLLGCWLVLILPGLAAAVG